MKIRVQDSFLKKLNRQVAYIAQDKPIAARNFKKRLLKHLTSLKDFPYKHRKSIYFEDEEIRDLIFERYTIVFQINKEEIIVFGFVKDEEVLNKPESY